VALEIPKVGLVMENARLVRWLKDVGDVVQQGEPLLELETEKSVVEIESTESGRLVEILLRADQEARVGDRIAWMENDAPGAEIASAQVAGAQVAGAQVASAALASPAVAPAPPDASRPGEAPRIRSSPVARRLAAEHALDLQRIRGSGPNGRVQLIDVRRALETSSGAGTLGSAQPLGSAPPGVQPLSSMRRALARSMTLSNAAVPQFAVERAVDWTVLERLRAKLIAELPAAAARPSVTDFLLQGIARALERFPALNVTFHGDAGSPDAGVVPAQGAHIGLVVAVDQGLLVPVFHHVEQLGLIELVRRRQETVERALQGKLKREELEGATFSVSNLGAGGPDRFNALINPPQSAILAVGRRRDSAVARDGRVQVRPLSELTLTVDHRVADGRLAADFLACLVEILEGEDWQLQ
jgi:pyruvate dehydrogenase E2 component (dihydrolipoamide acetyltransferase)